jgi:alpha-glucosidase
MTSHADLPWWKRGVVYQIYPRSFMDADGDGVGDLEGIIQRLDHLVELGVDALWLSPIQPSPDADFGYDISDYCDVHPQYGDLATFDRLVAACRERGLRVVLDGVFNHSSDQHPWFLESRSSRDNPKADWYLWRDGAGGPGETGAPNNWTSTFGGGGWEYAPERRQYFFHSFLPQQPDLNWRNPAVVDAIEGVLRFWMERGVEGFRLDVFNCYFKHPQLPSNPRTWNPAGLVYGYIGQRHVHDRDQEDMRIALSMMRGAVDEAPGRFLVGETLDEDRRYRKAARYAGERPDQLHLAFNFHLLRSRWSARAFHAAILAWTEALGPEGWPTWVLSNHDFPRHASRWGGRWADARCKLAAVLAVTLRGTPFLYYGEEIGMRERKVPRSEIQDPVGQRFWPVHPGRDGCRTPMQWGPGPHGGFSSGEPWLGLHSDHRQRHVAAQREDPGSVLATYRAIIALRRRLVVLQAGDLTLPEQAHAKVLSYRRGLGDASVRVLLNMSPTPQSWSAPPERHLLHGTHPTRPAVLEGGTWELAPHEGLVLGSEPITAG